MKKYLSIILILFTVNVTAQTNTFPSSGNVGIGITTPNYLLELIDPSNTKNVQLRLGNSATSGLGYQIGRNISNGYLTFYGEQTSANGYSFGGIDGTRMIINSSGNVGIGTTNPLVKLAVDAPYGEAATNGTIQNGILRLQTAQSIGWGEVLDFGMHVGVSGPPSYAWLQATNKENLAIQYNLSINPNGGNVGIGTTNPGIYKLAVEGTLGARKIKVTQANPWADYVFNENYKLRPLSQVERYIKEQKHLPEVPTAKQINENGIDIGETEALLLKKIEELTLYIIKQEKQIKVQESRIKKLENKK